MSNINKILLATVIVLLLVLIGLVIRQQFSEPTYSAVYLRTGDLYFGELTHFPYFGLKRVYTLQVNPQGSATPFSIQKFSNVVWGPEDFLKINREQVVWTTRLRSDSELVKIIQTNPNLEPPKTAPSNATSSSQ